MKVSDHVLLFECGVGQYKLTLRQALWQCMRVVCLMLTLINLVDNCVVYCHTLIKSECVV